MFNPIEIIDCGAIGLPVAACKPFVIDAVGRSASVAGRALEDRA